MNADEIRDLAAVYALGGLDGDDRARFEALLLAGDREAAAALQEFEGTLVEMVGTGTIEVPPPAVKQALMARIASETAARPSAAPVKTLMVPPRARRSFWPAVWSGALAAGIAAIAVGFSVSATYEQRLNSLAQEAATLRAELSRQQAIVALVRDPATQVVSLAGLEPAPSARARMIWNAPAGGLLVAAGLPPAPSGKTYQLWAIAGKQAPVSAGVFDVDAQGGGSLPVPPLPGVDKVDTFAVTLEPAGGLPAPSGQMYLAGKS